MSVYNGSRYLQEAVESILAQTLTDLEFVIVDDGSSDGCCNILSEYRDSRIRLLTNPSNRGLADSLNRAVSEARGAYVARQDADDLSLPERLERQADCLDREPMTGVVGCAAQWIDPDGQFFGKVWPVGYQNEQLQTILFYTCPLIHGSVMFRRQCFDQAGGYDAEMRSGQDYDFWLRLSETWDLLCLPETLYKYRQHPAMVSVQHSAAQSGHAAVGLTRAVDRRRHYALASLGLAPDRLPVGLCAMSHRRLAQRYVCWSAGASHLSRGLALGFLLAALRCDPTTPEIWRRLLDIVTRKGARAKRRSGTQPAAEAAVR